MQTHLAPEFAGTPAGEAAEAILRQCVHCGFCTATCPTYQLLGDELDGPRGRIYLIKQVMEGVTPTRETQAHLDRCLTCRNCETTCPSGVQYGHLVDIGRRVVDAKVERPAGERRVRWLLKEGLTSPLFKPALRVGQALRPLVPAALKDKVPPKPPATAHDWPTRQLNRKVALLLGCVQPAMAPNINSATARVLDAAGIQTVVADEAGCCGAIREHLGDHDGALDHMRRNIDAWWPLVAGPGERVEALVMNASGCGATVKEYGHALAHGLAVAQHIDIAQDLTPRLALGFEVELGPKRHGLQQIACNVSRGPDPRLAIPFSARRAKRLEANTGGTDSGGDAQRGQEIRVPPVVELQILRTRVDPKQVVVSVIQPKDPRLVDERAEPELRVGPSDGKRM